MQVQGINIQRLQLQMIQQMVTKFSPEAAESLDIGSILNGSSNTNAPSGVNLSQIEQTEIYSLMSSVMDTLMIARMFESMGMSNPFDTKEAEYTESTASAGNKQNSNGITIPGIENIIEGSEIAVDGEDEAQEVKAVNYDNGTGDLILNIGDTLYKRVNGIGIDNQNTYGNVFVKVIKKDKNIFGNIKTESYEEDTASAGTVFYYVNGTMKQIDNTTALSSGKKVALGAVIYEIKEDEEDNKLKMFDPNGNKKEFTAMGIDNKTGREVYKMGNATYELESGVLVPRSTQMEVGGTIEIVTPSEFISGQATTTGVSGRVTHYIAGKEFDIDGERYTRFVDTNKKYSPTLNIYTNSDKTKYFILEGTTLTQFNPEDMKYFRNTPGREIEKTTDNQFILGTGALNNNGTTSITLNAAKVDDEGDKYYTTTENGETKVYFYDDSTKKLTEVTNDTSFFKQGVFDGQAASIVTDGNTVTIEEPNNTTNVIATLTKCAKTDAVAAKFAPTAVYISTDNQYYTFRAGIFTEITGEDLITGLDVYTYAGNEGKYMRIEGSDIICETRDEQGVVTDRIRYMKKNVSGQTIFDSQDYFDKVYQSDKGGYYRIDLTSGTKEEIPYWILVDLGLISETATNTAYDNKGNAITYNLNNRIGSGYSFGKLTTWGVDDELVIYAINPQYIVCKEDSTLVYIDTNNGSVVKTLDVSLPTLNGIAYSYTDDGDAFNAIQDHFDPGFIALYGAYYTNTAYGIDTDNNFDNWDHVGLKDRSQDFNKWLGNGNMIAIGDQNSFATRAVLFYYYNENVSHPQKVNKVKSGYRLAKKDNKYEVYNEYNKLIDTIDCSKGLSIIASPQEACALYKKFQKYCDLDAPYPAIPGINA